MEAAYIESTSLSEGEEVVWGGEGEEFAPNAYSDDELDTGAGVINGPVLSRSALMASSFIPRAGAATTVVNEPPKRKRGRPRKDSTGSVGSTVTPAPQKTVRFQQQDDEEIPRLPTAAESARVNREREAMKMAAQMMPFFDKKVKEERKKSGGVEWDITQVMAEEEREVKEGLLRKIEMYYKFFEDKCWATSTRKTKWSYRSSVKELEEEVKRCKKELDIERGYNALQKGHIFLVYGLEKLAIEGFGVPVHGVTKRAAESAQIFEDELKEIAIDHSDWFTMGAKGRYALQLFSLFNTVLNENRKLMQATMAAKADGSPDIQGVQAELLQKYDSL